MKLGHGSLIVEEAMICLLQGSLNLFFFISLSLLFLGQYPLRTKGEEQRRQLSPPTQTVEATDDVGNWLML